MHPPHPPTPSSLSHLNRMSRLATSCATPCSASSRAADVTMMNASSACHLREGGWVWGRWWLIGGQTGVRRGIAALLLHTPTHPCSVRACHRPAPAHPPTRARGAHQLWV